MRPRPYSDVFEKPTRILIETWAIQSLPLLQLKLIGEATNAMVYTLLLPLKK